MAKGNARADTDTVLQTQVTQLKEQAQEEQKNVLTGAQSQWLIPDKQGWNGDLFDFQGMEKMFSRTQSNQWFADAMSDVKNPGTSGDLAVTTVQIDLLAAMERAWRMRHTMRRPRTFCHAMGRKNGHGDDSGPLVQCQLEYVRGLTKQSKGTGTV